VSRWFRHYAGMMRDEKLVRAAVKSKQPVERVVWVWGAILESASEINDGGRYELDVGEAAYFLRCDEADLAGIVTSLSDLGRLAGGVVARWGDRQYSSDAAAERQRRYRERKAANRHDEGDSHHNGDAESDVTPPSRDGRVTVQETDTELEAEEEKNISLESEREFEDWYAAFPKHVGKGQARRSYRAARRKASAETLLLAAKRAAAVYSAGDPRFTPHPATWLNGERWLDVEGQDASADSDERVYRGVL
jgi:hypothetical protein